MLDLEMPGMDGERLAEALRTLFPGNPPLLIALSGNVVRLVQIKGNGIFDHHLSKPIDVKALKLLIQERFAKPH